jgi:protein-arginine kinase activator protein McsA
MLENMDNPTDLDLEIGTELNKIQPSKLEELTKEFNKAIEDERYEDAGKIKQQINELRKEDEKENN